MKFYLNFAERVGWTAVQAAGAVLIETGIDDFEGWAVIRNAAILSAVKVLLSTKLPWTSDDTGSSLPESTG